MRLGFVCLTVVLGTPWVAMAQYGVPPGAPAHEAAFLSLSSEKAIVRPDGTFVLGDVPAAPAEIGVGAISYRHYAHAPKKEARGYYAKAAKAHRGGNEGEALDRLHDAVRADPEFFDAHLKLGVIWLEQEAPAQALPHLERALAIDGSSQTAQALAAWSLLQLGRAREAEMAARRAQQLGRSIEVVDYLLQEARARQGKPAKAVPIP